MVYLWRHRGWTVFGVFSLSSSAVLWDWGSIFILLIIGVCLAAMILPLVAVLSQQETPSPAPGTPEQPEWLRPVILSFVLLPGSALLLTIVGIREEWPIAHQVLRPVVDFASAIIPAVSKVPKEMAEEGFRDRFFVTQAAAAVAYLLSSAIALVMFCWLFWASSDDRPSVMPDPLPMERKPSLTKSVLGCLCIFAIAVWSWHSCGIYFEPQFKEGLGNFETSDLSLFLRFWFWPLPLFTFVAAGASPELTSLATIPPKGRATLFHLNT